VKILFLAPRHPDRPTTGAELRDWYLTRELSRFASVVPVGVDDWNGFRTVRAIARAITSRTPFPVIRLHTRDTADRLERLLAYRIDLILVHSPLLASYLDVLRAARGRPPIVCDWHNVESEVMTRYGMHARRAPLRWYGRVVGAQLARHEEAVTSRFDAHFAVTERDRQHLLELAPDARVFRVPNGVDVAAYSPESIERVYMDWVNGGHVPQGRHRILFVGSMDYRANADAVVKFARTVWPAVRAARPELVLTIVGRKPRRDVRALAALPDVEVTGTVADVRPYYREAVLSIVPLEIAGGSRLKILESFAAGVPVVSTPVGAEGLDVVDGRHVLLATNGEAFGRAILDLAGACARREFLIAGARALAARRYDWRIIGAELRQACDRLVRRGVTTAPSGSRILALHG
jgi:glycosyltransferase involved in cell wall biosynthesis